VSAEKTTVTYFSVQSDATLSSLVDKWDDRTGPVIVAVGKKRLSVCVQSWVEWEIESEKMIDAILVAFAACYSANMNYSLACRNIYLFLQVRMKMSYYRKVSCGQ
jgi:hypothetical protein